MPRRLFAVLCPIVPCLLVLALSGPAWAKSNAEIDAEVNQALERLYAESSAAKELGAKAVRLLVFPDIAKGGLILGGEYGEGALRVGGQTEGYYSSASASVGLQIGVSSRSLVLMFMTEAALKKFTANREWEAGVDADVTAVDAGATGSIDTTTAKDAIIGFNFGEEGLMAGVSIEGTKIEKMDR